MKRVACRLVFGCSGGLVLAALAAGTWVVALQPGIHRAVARPGLASLPGLRGAVSAAMGRDDPGYSVVGLRAANRAQRLRVAFSRAGVTVMSRRVRLRMVLSGFGYAGEMRVVSAARPVAASNQVAYTHRGVREWYANGPLGLEQGFDVLSRPTEGRGPLTLSVALAGGVRPRLEHGEVWLGDQGMGLRYGDLVVTDARGRAVHSWLAVRPGGLQIRVDDRVALYPLRIDPLVQQGSKLTGSGEIGSTTDAPNGEFGTTVALSSDGNTALIGGDTDNGSAGAAWVFTRSGGTWTQQGPKLTGSGESGNGQFGRSVALSSDGNTALIGGSEDNGSVGAAWVFTRSSETWTQQGPKLIGSGGISQSTFGISVALSSDGNTALMGGKLDNFGLGAAWVFTRSGGTWTQQGPKLTPSDTGDYGVFGTSVALSSDGNTALIGGSAGLGAAWVFTRSGGTWTEEGPRLTGGGEGPNGTFGISVALSSDGNTGLIGGELDNGDGADSGVGAAWVFTRSGATWTQQGAKLTGSGELGNGNFGSSVALSADGNTGLIGGFGDHNYVGAAWVFTRSGAMWTQQGAKLTGSGELGNGLFGASVALSADGNTGLIGGPVDNSYVGAAWVFVTGSMLTVSLSGTGFGRVASAPVGIDCPGTCAHTYARGAAVTLTATPYPGSTFGGWFGRGCSGGRTCTLTPSSDQIISAAFTAGLGTLQLVGPPTTTPDGVRFRLKCNAAVRQRCQSTDTLTSTETLNGAKPIAISAAHTPKNHRRTIVVGRRRVTIAAGTPKTITITLNRLGRSLVKRFHQLPVTLAIALTNHGKVTTSVKRKLTIKQEKKHLQQ